MWHTELPASYACGDQTHIVAKTRNVLIFLKNESMPHHGPRNVMIGTEAGKVGGLTEVGKFGGSSASFRTAFV
jgi:hypothetical protein